MLEQSPLRNIKEILEGNEKDAFLVIRFENENFAVFTVKLPKE